MNDNRMRNKTLFQFIMRSLSILLLFSSNRHHRQSIKSCPKIVLLALLYIVCIREYPNNHDYSFVASSSTSTSSSISLSNTNPNSALSIHHKPVVLLQQNIAFLARQPKAHVLIRGGGSSMSNNNDDESTANTHHEEENKESTNDKYEDESDDTEKIRAKITDLYKQHNENSFRTLQKLLHIFTLKIQAIRTSPDIMLRITSVTNSDANLSSYILFLVSQKFVLVMGNHEDVDDSGVYKEKLVCDRRMEQLLECVLCSFVSSFDESKEEEEKIEEDDFILLEEEKEEEERLYAEMEKEGNIQSETTARKTGMDTIRDTCYAVVGLCHLGIFSNPSTSSTLCLNSPVLLQSIQQHSRKLLLQDWYQYVYNFSSVNSSKSRFLEHLVGMMAMLTTVEECSYGGRNDCEELYVLLYYIFTSERSVLQLKDDDIINELMDSEVEYALLDAEDAAAMNAVDLKKNKKSSLNGTTSTTLLDRLIHQERISPAHENIPVKEYILVLLSCTIQHEERKSLHQSIPPAWIQHLYQHVKYILQENLDLLQQQTQNGIGLGSNEAMIIPPQEEEDDTREEDDEDNIEPLVVVDANSLISSTNVSNVQREVLNVVDAETLLHSSDESNVPREVLMVVDADTLLQSSTTTISNVQREVLSTTVIRSVDDLEDDSTMHASIELAHESPSGMGTSITTTSSSSNHNETTSIPYDSHENMLTMSEVCIIIKSIPHLNLPKKQKQQFLNSITSTIEFILEKELSNEKHYSNNSTIQDWNEILHFFWKYYWNENNDEQHQTSNIDYWSNTLNQIVSIILQNPQIQQPSSILSTKTTMCDVLHALVRFQDRFLCLLEQPNVPHDVKSSVGVLEKNLVVLCDFVWMDVLKDFDFSSGVLSLDMLVDLLWSYSILHFSPSFSDTRTNTHRSSQSLSTLGQIYSNLEYAIFHTYSNTSNETVLSSPLTMEEEYDAPTNDHGTYTTNSTYHPQQQPNTLDLVSNLSLSTLSKLLQASSYIQIYSNDAAQQPSSPIQQQLLLNNNQQILNDHYINRLLQLVNRQLSKEEHDSNQKQTNLEIIRLCQACSLYIQRNPMLLYTTKETLHTFYRSVHNWMDHNFPTTTTSNSYKNDNTTRELTKGIQEIDDTDDYVILLTLLYQIQHQVESLDSSTNDDTRRIASKLFKSIPTRGMNTLSSSSFLQLIQCFITHHLSSSLDGHDTSSLLPCLVPIIAEMEHRLPILISSSSTSTEEIFSRFLSLLQLRYCLLSLPTMNSKQQQHAHHPIKSFPPLAHVLLLQCNEYCHELMTQMIIHKKRTLSTWSITELQTVLRHFLLFTNNDTIDDSKLIDVWITSMDQEIKKRKEVLKAASNMVQSSSSTSWRITTKKRNSIFSLIGQASKLSIDVASSLSSFSLSIVQESSTTFKKRNKTIQKDESGSLQPTEDNNIIDNVRIQINKVAAISCEVDTYLERIGESCFGISSSSNFLDDVVCLLEQEASFHLGKCSDILHLYHTKRNITGVGLPEVYEYDVSVPRPFTGRNIGIDFLCKLANI